MAARVKGLEKTSVDHQDLIFGIEKATSDRADELDIELKDYKHSNKEDLRSLRKYIACFGLFCSFFLNLYSGLNSLVKILNIFIIIQIELLL